MLFFSKERMEYRFKKKQKEGRSKLTSNNMHAAGAGDLYGPTRAWVAPSTTKSIVKKKRQNRVVCVVCSTRASGTCPPCLKTKKMYKVSTSCHSINKIKFKDFSKTWCWWRGIGRSDVNGGGGLGTRGDEMRMWLDKAEGQGRGRGGGDGRVCGWVRTAKNRYANDADTFSLYSRDKGCL